MEDKYPIPQQLAEDSLCNNEKYLKMYQESIDDPKSFWDREAKRLHWYKEWDNTFDFDFHKPEIKWFTGGKINVSDNCIDRHLEKRSEKTAIIWEDDSGDHGKKFTYRELHEQVCKFANVLKQNGVKKGDRVTIYMGMVPELAFAMLACARLGAIHSIIFGGFSKDAIRTRAIDSQCKLIITQNIGIRGGKKVFLKKTVDEGIEGLSFVKRVIVVDRTDDAVNMVSGRDVSYEDEIKKVDANCAPEILDSEDPLFILYTSGSTGQPKGVLHTQAGYLLYASLTHQYVFDVREDDVYFCAADIGWITGHSYIIYGPLANGATTVMFESLPTYPDPGRYWKMIEKYKVNSFYTAPTAIRALAKEGESHPNRYDLSSLRVLGTVGEPINKDAWIWYREIIGKNNCNVVDTWWQTETGGIMITPLPGATETKPGSATRPFFGIQPIIFDEKGNEQLGNPAEGRLCIKHSWPSQMRTVYGDHERFKKTYFSDFPGYYFSGDGCKRDEDGYYWITGRVDDVLNVSGHRFGTAEIESSIVSSGLISEVAVVGFPHDIKGEAIFAFSILRNEVAPSDDTQKKVIKHVSETIGPVARPDKVLFVPGLPKTRSGKIMRRILRKIASGELENFGDISTLADPDIVAKIVDCYKSSNQ